MAKFDLSSLIKGTDGNMELNERSTRVNKQLHTIGLLISIMMFVVTLVLLGLALFKIYSINKDFRGGNVTYETANSVNQLVAWLLLLLVTSMTGLVFFRLYQAKPPFSRGNIRIIRMVAIILMLLSVLPILFQVGVAGIFNIPIKMSINFMYIFIGIIFYCIAYIFEHGEIMQKRTSETVDVQENMILTLAETAEAKSGNIGQHIKRVSEYTRIIAKNMGMSDEEVENLRLGSMLHDIGNILIPIEILEKESSLNDEEFAIMKTHVIAGEQLLQNAQGSVMETARQIALDHHEHWDGAGYMGKVGKEISLAGRIVAVADSFDMLINARGYKSGWDTNKVYHGIVDDSGKKFDPEVIKTFIVCYKDLLEIYKNYNMTVSKDAPISEEIAAGYDKILGKYSPRNKPKEEETVTASKAYQDVELDLRRLI
jgi:HD-GYP domain